MSEQRKTVTVVFCDLAGSTALGETVDPERLRALLARYFDEMKAIVERHGGTVEKFIGDAVMAVFGVPVVHEDDALRAVRAASEMRAALPELGLEGRIGVMTGEVVTGTEERLATGDAVNVAARLEQAAQPGEVLVGEATLAFVHAAVDVEQVEPLILKGKSEPVPAHRLFHVHDAPERRHDTPFVGRERELAQVREAWERVSSGLRCELVTIVGDAGVGKSRLALEFLHAVEARVVRGRCRPYGEGVSYGPVVEVLRDLGDRPADEAAAVVIRTLLGEEDESTSSEEIAWAFRKTLEQAAGERPLVVVFDDIQWGEEAFHDLIEHVTLLSTGVAILLLCMARPELVERRPTWPVGIRLAPLPSPAVDELIPGHLPDELRARIARAAGGNPLFVGEMLAIAAETDGDVVVPATLKALLAARLDQLQPAERAVLERGAIEGETFHRGAVQALAPDDTQITPRLAALVRKELIRPDRPLLAGEDGFSFRHLLLRDAAYDALPKAMRAEFHERYAAWLEQVGRELLDRDETPGYHLEQAHRYLVELGSDDEHVQRLALRAGRLLASAGRRAHARGDDGGAHSLLGRATRLLAVDDLELPELLVLLGSSTYEAGDAPGALEALRRAQTTAAATGQRGVELRGRMVDLAIKVRLDQDPAAALAEAEAAIAELVQLDDPESLARAWRAVIEIGFVRADYGLVGEASRHLLECARRTGIRRDEVWAVRGIAAAFTYGPMPVAEAITRVEQALAEFPKERAGEDHLALLYAFAGRFEDAEEAMERSRQVRIELGQRLDLAMLSFDAAWIALLAGRPESAESDLRAAADVLTDAGDQDMLSGVAALLADVLYRLGRDAEAEDWTRRSEQAAPQAEYWRSPRAKVVARRGDAGTALRLSAEAVEMARRGDSPPFLADALCDRAEVLVRVGRPGDARPLLEEALALYERKGVIPATERTRARLAELEQVTRR